MNIIVAYPKSNNAYLEKLAKEYIDLKIHEFSSIVSKIQNENCHFHNRVNKNTYNDYQDIEITLIYNYTDYEIREDKFYHTLNDELIDIEHFARNKEALIELLLTKLSLRLKKYKINKDMLIFLLNNTLDNFLVTEEGLLYKFPLTKFGLKEKGEEKILIKYTELMV